MRLLRSLLAAALAIFAVAASPPPHPNWNTTVTVTPSGSHVLGNPDAKIKLAEYVSYTCPHCAAFEREGVGVIRLTALAQGKVSFEVRHLVRDPIDMTAAMLTNCGPPSKFFLNHAAFLRSQATWIDEYDKAGSAQRLRWTTGSNPSRFRAIADDFKFYEIMETRGYDRVEVDRCLADEAMAKRLAAQTQGAEALNVEGTPSFLIDGVLLAGTHDWATLRPQLAARL